jgi:hypothetical protein
VNKVDLDDRRTMVVMVLQTEVERLACKGTKCCDGGGEDRFSGLVC